MPPMRSIPANDAPSRNRSANGLAEMGSMRRRDSMDPACSGFPPRSSMHIIAEEAVTLLTAHAKRTARKSRADRTP